MSKALYVFTDGGAKRNPGPAGIGFVIKNSRGKILVEQGKFIGETTNNVAEYMAVIEALKWIKADRGLSQVSIADYKFFLDSKLVVGQLNGIFKVKNKSLRSLIIEVRKLEQEIRGNVSYHFIPREKNRRADFLVQEILSKY